MARTEIEPEQPNVAGGENRKYSFAEIRKILFPNGPPKRHTIEELKEGIEAAIREEHGRR